MYKEIGIKLNAFNATIYVLNYFTSIYNDASAIKILNVQPSEDYPDAIDVTFTDGPSNEYQFTVWSEHGYLYGEY